MLPTELLRLPLSLGLCRACPVLHLGKGLSAAAEPDGTALVCAETERLVQTWIRLFTQLSPVCYIPRSVTDLNKLR